MNDVLTRARDRALEPVRVPWRAALRGFLVGLLAALVPASFVTRMVASQLPMAGAVVHGGTARAFANVLAVAAGLATAVIYAARENSR